MSYTCWSPWLFGILLLMTGLPLVLWGWRYSRQPASLSSKSLMYRFLRIYSPWPRTKRDRTSDGITCQEIKLHAVRSLAVGMLLEAAGIALVVVEVVRALYPNS